MANIVSTTWDSFSNVSLLAHLTNIKFFKHFVLGKYVLPNGKQHIFASRKANFACCTLACQFSPVDLATGETGNHK